MRGRLLFAMLGLLIALFIVWISTPFSSSAQSKLRWSPPQRIRGIAADSNPPYLVADQNRTVHAFYSQWTGGGLDVFYNQWTPTSGWTAPVDILLSPNQQQATVVGAFLDAKGTIHVIFYGGIEQGAEIYYSRVPAANAGHALDWSQPKLIGVQAASPVSGAMTGDGHGNLFVVYGGNQDGNGVYATYSVDGGSTWSNPISIFLTRGNSLLTCCLQVNLDEQGWLHAIWAVSSKNGQGRAIYYARLNANAKQWRFPVSLGESPGGLGVRDPAIMEHSGHVFGAFYDPAVGGHYVVRTSSDDGLSWADAFAPFPGHVGANGAGSFVVDANNDLHLFWGQRIPGTQGASDIHGMWYRYVDE